MFKPKQIAPFFGMTPVGLTEILKEIHLVYPLKQTPMGSFLLSEKDFQMIEIYMKTMMLFGNKKLVRKHLKDYVESKSKEAGKPEWYNLIQTKAS